MGYQTSTQQWSKTYIAKGVIACLGGLLLHCVIGSYYQWGMINIYVTSYYKTLDPSVTLQQNAIAFPLMMFCYGLTFRVGIYLTEIIHPIIVLSVVTVLYSATVFVASFMNEIWGFIALFGILFALIIGMTFMIPINQCNKYFPGKKLYVNGVVVAGTGLGPVIFGQFSYNYINPHSLHPVDGYYAGQPELVELVQYVPTMVRYLSLFYLCFGFVAILMMTPVILHNQRVKNEKQEKERLEKEQKIKNGQKIEEKVTQILKPHQAHKYRQLLESWVFWRQIIIIILLSTGLYMMNGNYKTYVKKDINDDKFLTLVGVLGAAVNGSCRILWSIFFLKTGYKTVVISIVGISIVVFGALRFTIQTKGAYLFLILLVNLGVGGIQSSNPSVVQYMFGQRMGQNTYGVFWCVVAIANFIQFVFVAYLGVVVAFNNLIYIGLGMAVIVIPIVLFSTFQGPWKNPTQQLEYCVTCHKPPIADNKQINETIQKLQANQSYSQFKSPVKNSQLTLSTLKVLPKKLEPIEHHQHFEITIKAKPSNIESSEQNAELQSSSKKTLQKHPISFISLDAVDTVGNENLNKQG